MASSRVSRKEKHQQELARPCRLVSGLDLGSRGVGTPTPGPWMTGWEHPLPSSWTVLPGPVGIISLQRAAGTLTPAKLYFSNFALKDGLVADIPPHFPGGPEGQPPDCTS